MGRTKNTKERDFKTFLEREYAGTVYAQTMPPLMMKVASAINRWIKDNEPCVCSIFEVDDVKDLVRIQNLYLIAPLNGTVTRNIQDKQNFFQKYYAFLGLSDSDPHDSKQNVSDMDLQAVEPFVLVKTDAQKQKMTSPATVRVGQDGFRKIITEAYGGRCCISGVSSVMTLQAAHIQGYINENSHHVQNGLLLRADLHLLFDNGMLGVDENYIVHISDKVKSDYQMYDGLKIRLPQRQDYYPSSIALKDKFNREFGH